MCKCLNIFECECVLRTFVGPARKGFSNVSWRGVRALYH